ncbi:uncharacterized protein si:dkey-250l23.4 [Hippoglossus hippoglossus]|uniref:uncharacterized protein si:dkey-250l23.4 n=1 Tax=Hippoglossus hippoglossus TaxID=8267 RepID=UPI00148BB14B|nr:uncharacterized protein si:dkey-250l23.4 [Hippoglossus hippoglossus]
MSCHAGASGVNGSSRVGSQGTEDASEERETYTSCLKTVRPCLRSADPAGEGRSSGGEHLMRPALPGRKSHRKTCREDGRGRWREDNQETEEERHRVGHVEGRDRGKQRQRKTERTETHGDGGTGSTGSSSSCNSVEAREGSHNFQRGHTCLRPLSIACSQTTPFNLNAQSPRPTMRAGSSSLPQPPIQSRTTPLSPQRRPAGASHRHPLRSSREPDPFWVEVGTGAATGRSSQSRRSTELGEEEEGEEEEEEVEDGEEEGSGVMDVMSQAVTPAVLPPCVPFGERRMIKREKNRIKCLRRRQRRRERWRQSQLESRQSSTGNPSSSSSEDEEDVSAGDREGYICAVCLDVYFSPYMCHPCNHVFCEPCLRTLAKNSPTNTPCPLCRTIITHVFFQKELNQTARTFFPKEYLSRKQNFQKASCAKWPLPSCRKLFRIFGGFQRQPSPNARRQFSRGGGYRLDALDFEDDSGGWRFDMDMVIIYIYSVNWVIGFFIFCFLCYLFFPSF